MKTKEIIFLKPDQLITHPRNMRKFYPTDQVREMADSILANNGVLQPLIIIKGKNGKNLVVDGNLRLAGGQLLKDKCPPLECKVVAMAEADQMLAMISANQVRYDVDPVSEALHYKALRDQGLSVAEISRRTGVYYIRIQNRIILADLEEPIQTMIVNGKLPCSPLVAAAMLKLSRADRLSLAKKIAANPNTKIKTILNACENLAKGKATKKLKRPAVQLAGVENESGCVGMKAMRRAANQTCRVCNQLERVHDRSPGWSVVAHAADDTCSSCDLKDMRNICEGCPVVELLRNLGNRKGGGK